MEMELQSELMCILHKSDDADSGSVVKKLMTTFRRKSQKLAAHKKWLEETKYDRFLINFPANYPTFGYHSSCYKNFTAVLKVLTSNSSSGEESGHKQTRSEGRFQRGLSSGVLVAKCIFFNCIKHNNLKVVTLDLSAEIKF